MANVEIADVAADLEEESHVSQRASTRRSRGSRQIFVGYCRFLAFDTSTTWAMCRGSHQSGPSMPEDRTQNPAGNVTVFMWRANLSLSLRFEFAELGNGRAAHIRGATPRSTVRPRSVRTCEGGRGPPALYSNDAETDGAARPRPCRGRRLRQPRVHGSADLPALHMAKHASGRCAV